MFGVSKNKHGYYVSASGGDYVHSDLKVHGSMLDEEGGYHYLSTREEAEARLKAFLLKSRNNLKEDHRQKQHLQLLLEGETTPSVTPILARLVSDGERVVLELGTPLLPYFAVARLEVRQGKVVMFREKGVKNQFVNTDKEGRIQN